MDDTKTQLTKYGIFLILSITLIFSVIPAHAQILEFENATVSTSSDTTIDNTINYDSWFASIFQQLNAFGISLTELSDNTINYISSSVSNVIQEEPKPTLKDCDQYETLKKEWFKCEQYNRDIASDKLTEKRINDMKSVSRGF